MARSGKRNPKDRRDAKFVKQPGLQTVMAALWPRRTDCEVFLQDVIDVTDLMSYIEKKNEEHPDYKTTVFHCVVAAIARMLKERPKMNCFVQGYRHYEHNDITLSFVAKRRFADGAEEALMVLKAEDDDTIDSISKRIYGDVREARKSEHATGGVDELLDQFAALPRPIMAAAIKGVRIMDFWGINPDFLTEGDPNYTSVLLSNLGSIRCKSVYHHLSNYGTCSIMVTLGTIHKEEMLMEDGTKEIRTVVDLGVTLDERIADGFYFARSLKLVKHIFEHPELLDQPIGEPSGFQYDA